MLVIGNGESRAGVDLCAIEEKTVGCNAVFRDFIPDHLICADNRMVQEAIDAGANQDSLIYTRPEWFDHYQKNHKRIRLLPELPYAGNERPDNPWHWGSGPYAVLLAAKLTEDSTVSMIGFDLYGNNGKVNNCYKNTLNYLTDDKSAVDPRYWIYQISKIFEIYSKVKFKIFQTEDWRIPKTWKKSNVSVDNISNLL